jgi:hypothetical protein
MMMRRSQAKMLQLLGAELKSLESLGLRRRLLPTLRMVASKNSLLRRSEVSNFLSPQVAVALKVVSLRMISSL